MPPGSATTRSPTSAPDSLRRSTAPWLPSTSIVDASPCVRALVATRGPARGCAARRASSRWCASRTRPSRDDRSAQTLRATSTQTSPESTVLTATAPRSSVVSLFGGNTSEVLFSCTACRSCFNWVKWQHRMPPLPALVSRDLAAPIDEPRQTQPRQGMMMPYTDYQTLSFDKRDRVLTITLNRPDRLNAINGVLHEELSRVFDELNRDRSVDVAILTGAGRAFCAGGDADWLETLGRGPARLGDPQRGDAAHRQRDPGVPAAHHRQAGRHCCRTRSHHRPVLRRHLRLRQGAHRRPARQGRPRGRRRRQRDLARAYRVRPGAGIPLHRGVPHRGAGRCPSG